MSLRLKPDIVIMDLMMPDVDGIAATERILAAEPTIKILVLTTSTVSDDLARALDAGAKGVITKNAEYGKLVAAIRDVAAGKIAVSSEVRHLIDEDPPAQSTAPHHIKGDWIHGCLSALSLQRGC